MAKDPNAILRGEASYSELERLSAVETLKGLKNKDTVRLGELVAFLESRGLWTQFAKITLGDLRQAFAPAPQEPAPKKKRAKKRMFDEEFGTAEPTKKKPAAPTDGGLSTDEVARMVLPFVEGNGEVTLDDVEEYTRLDKKVLRHHLGVLVKEGQLERLGVGRHAIYSTLG